MVASAAAVAGFVAGLLLALWLVSRNVDRAITGLRDTLAELAREQAAQGRALAGFRELAVANKVVMEKSVEVVAELGERVGETRALCETAIGVAESARRDYQELIRSRLQ